MSNNLKPLKKYVWFITAVSFLGCTSPAEQKMEGQAGKQSETHVSDQEDHDHENEHEVASTAASFSKALAKIVELNAKICASFNKGVPEDAHDALHDVGHTLERLPELAEKEGKLSPEQMSKLKNGVESLMDYFGQLDATLHDDKTVDFKDLELKLTQELNHLNEVVQ